MRRWRYMSEDEQKLAKERIQGLVPGQVSQFEENLLDAYQRGYDDGQRAIFDQADRIKQVSSEKAPRGEELESPFANQGKPRLFP